MRGTLAEEAGAVELVVEDGAVEEGEVDRRAGVVGDHRHGAQQQVLDRDVAVADDGDVGEVEQVGVRLHVGMEVEVGHEVVRLEERPELGRVEQSVPPGEEVARPHVVAVPQPVPPCRHDEDAALRRAVGAKSRSWRDRPVTTTRRAGQPKSSSIISRSRSELTTKTSAVNPGAE